MSEGFNLEAEYGGLLTAIEKRIGEPEDDTLAQYGVVGMKWGVRRDGTGGGSQLQSMGPDTITRKTASGETITMTKNPPTAVHKLIGRVSSTYRENYSKSASLTIRDNTGKKIGDAEVMKKNNEELYLNWLGIKKDSRGKGYATAIMKAGADFGRQQGFKRMTLEVPGISPDARHIYSKLGFKIVKEATKEEIDDDPVWGGLTEMVYDFDQVDHAEMRGRGSAFIAHLRPEEWLISRQPRR